MLLFGAKMVLCALAGLPASLRSAANLPAAAHKTKIFAPHNIIYYFSNANTYFVLVILIEIFILKTKICHKYT
jgi:hypothetical protein